MVDVLKIACKPVKDLTSQDKRVLKAEFERLYKRPLPPRPSTTFLCGNVAWGLQAEAMGKDPLKLRARILRQFKQLKTNKLRLQSGTQLIREWHGNTYHVTLTQDGYEYNNKTYKSLSQIAKLITGSHVSGNRFFGVKSSRGT